VTRPRPESPPVPTLPGLTSWGHPMEAVRWLHRETWTKGPNSRAQLHRKGARRRLWSRPEELDRILARMERHHLVELRPRPRSARGGRPPSPIVSALDPVPHNADDVPHRPGGASRRFEAEAYLVQFRDAVELMVPLAVLDWPGALEIVAAAEAELAAELLSWETSPSTRGAREVEDAGRGVKKAWRRAALAWAAARAWGLE